MSGRAGAPRIGVIIPFFQYAEGLLRRTLESVAAQELPPAQVVVVDDGSPRPATAEISPSLQRSIPGLTVISQPNRGVSAARNAALDALTADIEAVAVLDSDDTWTPAHLRTAADALALGADFYFANSTWEKDAGTKFDGHPELLAAAQPVAGVAGLMRWPGTPLALIGSACPFATASVVFRRALAPELRFPLGYRRAGEDHVVFWALLTRARSIMFGTHPTLMIGAGGVGIWQSATYGTLAHLERLTDEIRLRRHILGRYALAPIDRQTIREALAHRRSAALTAALHLLRRRQRGAAGEVLHLLRVDPGAAWAWSLRLPKVLLGVMRGADGGQSTPQA